MAKTTNKEPNVSLVSLTLHEIVNYIFKLQKTGHADFADIQIEPMVIRMILRLQNFMDFGSLADVLIQWRQTELLLHIFSLEKLNIANT